MRRLLPSPYLPYLPYALLCLLTGPTSCNPNLKPLPHRIVFDEGSSEDSPDFFRSLSSDDSPYYPDWFFSELTNCSITGNFHYCPTDNGVFQCWSGVCPDPDYPPGSPCLVLPYPVEIRHILPDCCSLFRNINTMLDTISNVLSTTDEPITSQDEGVYTAIEVGIKSLNACQKALVCANPPDFEGANYFAGMSLNESDFVPVYTPEMRCASHTRRAAQLIYLAAARDEQWNTTVNIDRMMEYINLQCILWKAQGDFTNWDYDCNPEFTQNPTSFPSAPPTRAPTMNHLTHLVVESAEEIQYITELQLILESGESAQAVSSEMRKENVVSSASLCIDGITKKGTEADNLYDADLLCATGGDNLYGEYDIRVVFNNLPLSQLGEMRVSNMRQDPTCMSMVDTTQCSMNIYEKDISDDLSVAKGSGGHFVLSYVIPTFSYDFRKCQEEEPVEVGGYPECGGQALIGLKFQENTNHVDLTTLEAQDVITLELKLEVDSAKKNENDDNDNHDDDNHCRETYNIVELASSDRVIKAEIFDGKLIITHSISFFEKRDNSGVQQDLVTLNSIEYTLGDGDCSDQETSPLHFIVVINTLNSLTLYVNGKEHEESIVNGASYNLADMEPSMTVSLGKDFVGVIGLFNIYNGKMLERSKSAIYIYETHDTGGQDVEDRRGGEIRQSC